MKTRITIVIPVLMMVSALATSFFLFINEMRTADVSIREHALKQARLDITRLRNVLYSLVTERGSDIQGARLNLSVTAMDTDINCLLLADEADSVLIANRYIWEGSNASEVCRYDLSIADKVRKDGESSVFFSGQGNSLLMGYYPVVLQLENRQGLPVKRVGILFVENTIASELSAAFNNSVSRSVLLAGVMLVVSAVVAMLLHGLVSRRLARLTNASRSLAAGNLDSRAALHGQDELAELGNAFDEMAIRIKLDISRRQLAEQELRELNETLEQKVNDRTKLLQEAQRIGRIGNWHLDVATGQLTWSEEFFHIFGYSPGEIEPGYAQFFSMVHPDDVAAIQESERQAFANHARHSVDHRIFMPDGEIRWAHEEGMVILNDADKIVSFSGTIQDITERKHIEQKLLQAKEDAERSSHAKSEFLSRMSHELRTPMNAILGFAQILDLELDDNSRQYVQEIIQAGDHLLVLIDELLDLGRIESGRMAMVLTNVDLSQVLSQAIKIVDPLVLQNKLTLHNNVNEKSMVIVDAMRLRQILVNLLSNAAKYNSTEGEIIISLQSCPEDRVRLLITDCGTGIAADNIPDLFVPFERLGAEKSSIDGTGIGLALSRQLSELMGCDLGFKSKVGQGSTFWVEMPRADYDREKEDAMEHESTQTTDMACKVLYIEDNPANLRLVEAMLKTHKDITLLSANNGQFGLELAQQYLPDIILLDIQLPDMDGYKVLNALREHSETRDIPVIAISADAMPLDVEKGLKAGFREYLTKPVRIEEVVRAIRTNITR